MRWYLILLLVIVGGGAFVVAMRWLGERTSPGFARFLSALAIAVTVTFVFGDVITGWWLYHFLRGQIASTGGVSNPNLLSALACVLTAAYYAWGVWIFKNILKLRRYSTVYGAATWASLMLIMYALAPNQVFDTQTGKALVKYVRSADGKIELFPVEVKFHPVTGQPTQDLTTDVAIEYDKQQKKKQQESPAPEMPKPDKKSVVHLPSDILWVENRESGSPGSTKEEMMKTYGRVHLKVLHVGLSAGYTILHVRAEATAINPPQEAGSPQVTLGAAAANRDGVYLLADKKRVYRFVEEQAEDVDYGREGGKLALNFHGSTESYLLFEPIDEDVTHMTFFHWQFAPMKVVIDNNAMWLHHRRMEALRAKQKESETPLQEDIKKIRIPESITWVDTRTPKNVWTSSVVDRTNLWVEKVGLYKTVTVLKVAAGGWNGQKGVIRSTEGCQDPTYITDQLGNVYPLLQDLGEYPVEGTTLYGAILARNLLPGEVYRFQLVFGPLDSNARDLTVYHCRFPPLSIGALDGTAGEILNTQPESSQQVADANSAADSDQPEVEVKEKEYKAPVKQWDPASLDRWAARKKSAVVRSPVEGTLGIDHENLESSDPEISARHVPASLTNSPSSCKVAYEAVDIGQATSGLLLPFGTVRGGWSAMETVKSGGRDPEYPPELCREGVAGQVTVALLLNEQGVMRGWLMPVPSDDRRFNKVVWHAVKDWKFNVDPKWNVHYPIVTALAVTFKITR